MTDTPLRVASPHNQGVPVAAAGEFGPLRVGPLAVWPPVVLAPMAGVTNYPFRRLCREFGAGLYVSEMITARGFLMMNRVTHRLAGSGPDEHPRSIQIYGRTRSTAASSSPTTAGRIRGSVPPAPQPISSR